MVRCTGAAHGIGIILDIHATNGSQNGFDHSAPVVVSGRSQQLWDSGAQPTPSYAAQAVSLVSTLAARYGTSPALLGFAVLNEPTVCPVLVSSAPWNAKIGSCPVLRHPVTAAVLLGICLLKSA